MRAKNEHRAHFMQMIEQWQQSGLSQKRFCMSNKIAYHVFHYWYRVYKSEHTASGSFLPVSITPASSQEQITISSLSGIQLQIPLTDQSIRFIKQLLLS